jgi:hypothetical protein
MYWDESTYGMPGDKLLGKTGHRLGPCAGVQLLTAGPTIAEAFNLLYQLETSCRAQVLALSAGVDGVGVPPEDVIALTGKVFAPTALRRYGLLEWPAMLRKVEAETKNNGYPYYAS